MEIEEQKSSHFIPDEVRWAVISSKKDGLSNKATARVISQKYSRSIDHKCVKRLWEKYQRTGSVEDEWNMNGRPKVLTEEDTEDLIEHCEEDRVASVRERKDDLELEASIATINRALLGMGYKAYSARKKPLLSLDNIQDRINFALEHQDWSVEDWHNVVFTDECAFRLVNSNGRTRIRRLEEEEWEEGTYQASGVGKSVMVWGAISAHGASCLARFGSTVTADAYIGILRHRLRRIFPGLYGGDLIYMHDNAPAHTANITIEWLEGKDIETLDWPARSPDLNIIENVWGRIKYELRTAVFEDFEEVWDEVKKLWKQIVTEDFIHNLYESLPRRIEAVIHNEGRHTKY